MSTTSETQHQQLETLMQDAREVHPDAFLVLPRVLRRVIKEVKEIPTLARRIPHQFCYVVEKDQLTPLVAPDELGLISSDEIPFDVLLLTKPEENEWNDSSDGHIRRETWRQLFHASIDVKLQVLRRTQQFTTKNIRARIDELGQVEFDEIVWVLYQEGYIVDRENLEDAYAEFVAVFAEFYFFSPAWIPTYFPSLGAVERVLEIISREINVRELFEETRIPGSLEPGATTASTTETEPKASPVKPATETVVSSKPNAKKFARLMQRAEKASERENSVSAAIHYTKARQYAEVRADFDDADNKRDAAIDRLVERLGIALEFEPGDAEPWRDAISKLVDLSLSGFWRADKKLLYDLQNVCVDHERGVYRVDLIEYLRTFGKRPIKRALPNQREVLMSKHLRNASRRLVTARLSGEEREQLDMLLHRAAHSAEKQLRRRLRPLIEESLREVELLPANVPEDVAWHKLIDELSDCVVHRGFLTMGDFRDALSRSHLKLPDLDGVKELWRGDRLLKADRKLDEKLDGVYHRGEFYLRWLQAMSSIAFGTRIGRFVTLYLAIPFGGAFVALEGVKHLLELVMHPSESMEQQIAAMFPAAVILLGIFIGGLMHITAFRAGVANIFRQLFRGLKGLAVELPQWFMTQPLIKGFLKSGLMRAINRYLFWPALFAVFIGIALPWVIHGSILPWPWLVILFLSLNLIFNSRVGRDCEEVGREWVAHQWHRIRVGVFVALFEVVMDFFKWLLQSFERFLYAVDEWLRFRSGETSLSLGIKAALGVIWSVVAYISRFCVTLLIEPQVNPIKHFPVVTVSHKIILPLQPMFASLLEGPLNKTLANTWAVAIVTVLPGVFGFLVWELKSNWNLYVANRSPKLKPAIVGDHGETVIQLMKPGFHSGTLPKLYNKLRKAERKAINGEQTVAKSRHYAHLHHLEIALRHFIEREFLKLIHESPVWNNGNGGLLRVGEISLASNNIRIKFHRNQKEEEPLCLAFEEQSGWLVAGVLEPGWLADLTESQTRDFIAVLAGFYKISGVDLVREQMMACFSPPAPPYDIAESGLVMWPGGDYRHLIRYHLHSRGPIRPRPRSTARLFGFSALEPSQLIYRKSSILWDQWVTLWERRKENPQAKVAVSFPVTLLPATKPAG